MKISAVGVGQLGIGVSWIKTNSWRGFSIDLPFVSIIFTWDR